MVHPRRLPLRAPKQGPRASHRTTASAARPFESLEGRVMMSVSQDASGFTVIGPSADSKVIYVSSSQGNDGNAGTSVNAPVKTIAKGKSLLRNGMPDQMLLKKGDAWYESIGTGGLSGRAADEPMVIGSYGADSADR